MLGIQLDAELFSFGELDGLADSSDAAGRSGRGGGLALGGGLGHAGSSPEVGTATGSGHTSCAEGDNTPMLRRCQ
jgi:hypothetical protein